MFFRGLKRKDLFSKSDPMIVTYEQIIGQNKWGEIHRTEVIMNSHDVEFITKLVISNRFEEKRPLKFEVYDIDSKDPNLNNNKHDFLGTAEASLGQLSADRRVSLRKLILLKES